MQDRHIVLHNGGLADHDAGGVVDQNAATHPGGGMDVHVEANADLALEEQCQGVALLVPKPMGDPLCLEGNETP